MNNMNEKNAKEYIAGFDWVKLLGSIQIAAFHIWLYSVVIRDNMTIKKAVVFLYGIVLLFFMVSGYLMYGALLRKRNPIKYMFQYVIKYACLYVLAYLLYYVPVYIQIYRNTGINMWKDMLYVILTSPVKSNALFHLWFIPPLLCGIIIATPIFLYHKERVFLRLVIPVAVLCVCLTTYSDLFRQISFLQVLYDSQFSGAILRVLSEVVARGILFVFIGMWIAKYRISFEKWNYKRWIFPAIVLTVIEEIILQYKVDNVNWIDMNFSVCFWAILVFYGVLHIKGASLRKYHAEVTIFSGITYFFHIWEAELVQNMGISNRLLILLLVMAVNLFFTCLIGKGREKQILRRKNGL